MADASLKATSSEQGSSKLLVTTSTPSEAGATDFGEVGSRVTPRSVYGEGDSERKYESTDPPWLPVAPRTTRSDFSEDMAMACQKRFDGSDNVRIRG